jgi:hypothetical protein
VLPPADVQVVHCELTEAEKDFYGALYKKSKVFSIRLKSSIVVSIHLTAGKIF